MLAMKVSQMTRMSLANRSRTAILNIGSVSRARRSPPWKRVVVDQRSGADSVEAMLDDVGRDVAHEPTVLQNTPFELVELFGGSEYRTLLAEKNCSSLVANHSIHRVPLTVITSCVSCP